MKEFAAGFIVAFLMAYLIVMVLGVWFFLPSWKLERSPNTGICYEVVTRYVSYYIVTESHPVDISYCEKGEGR